MNNKLSINISDYHIKKYNQLNKTLSDWEVEMYYYTNQQIVKVIKKYKPYRVNLLGDIFDSIPSNIELFIFKDLISLIRNIDMIEYKGKDIEIFCINGNHTLLPNQQNKTYYKGLLKDFFKKEYNINVLEYEEVKTPYHKNPFLYCSHGSINRLETLTKNYSVVFSHFRSSNPKDKAIYSDEIDTTILKAKADLVVLGDIHTRLNYDNVVYCGSPICTAFHDKEDLPSILLLNEETLKWEWVDTIKDIYNKKVVQFTETDDMAYILAKMKELEEDSIKFKSFYKVKIVNTKSFISSLKLEQFKHFCIAEPTYTDMKVVDVEQKEIMEIIKEANISNIGTELDFESYVHENNSRKELTDKVKMTLNFIKGGIFNE